MSGRSSPTEVANAPAIVEMGETTSEIMDPSLAIPVKGKGKSKRMFAGDNGVQHASEEDENSTGSGSELKKAKLAVCDCSHQVSRLEADLVKEKGEKEKLQQELKTIQEELARYQKEQDTLLGIIERLRKQGK
jgi:predicted RNase H-like nuclease (RuvC/YqgF family)